MVALTMATLFKQKHDDISSAQDYIWHCDRYKNLITLLKTLYDKIKSLDKKEGAFVLETLEEKTDKLSNRTEKAKKKTYMKFKSIEMSLMKDITMSIRDDIGKE
jgi:uncharacterized protein (UPF0305 family)